jgi:hypothetical protein
MLCTPVGQAAREKDIWTEGVEAARLHECQHAVRHDVRYPAQAAVVGLVLATGGIATLDLYLFASSGFH